MFKEIRERLESGSPYILHNPSATVSITELELSTILKFTDEAISLIKLGFSDKQYYQEYQDFLKRWEGK